MTSPGCKPGQDDVEDRLLPMQQVPPSTLLVNPKEQQELAQFGTNSVAGVVGTSLKPVVDRLRKIELQLRIFSLGLPRPKPSPMMGMPQGSGGFMTDFSLSQMGCLTGLTSPVYPCGR